MRPVLLAALAALASACGTPDRPGPRSTLTQAQAADARAACTFAAGTPAGLSLGADERLGSEIPIDTVVLLMMENRSFDHLLGSLRADGQPDADVAALDATNPDAQGRPVPRYRLSTYCTEDTNHEWDGSHAEWDGGKNDGFVVANQQLSDGGATAMGYYTAADLPITYALASTFATSDRHFSSLLGPTFPNRDYFYAASSFGSVDNDLFTKPTPTLIDALEGAGVTWHGYRDTLPGWGGFLDTYAKHLDSVDKSKQFFLDAAAGTLPEVVLLDPNLDTSAGAIQDSFHPPGDPQLGDRLFGEVVSALVASPQWPRAALFILFDEGGGFYDHVPPPAACPPDGTAPARPGGGFDRLGFRVPLIVVSPWARPHHVSHVVTDHTSVLRFLEARFGLPSLTARDANADPMMDLFDFSAPALLHPPPLPAPVVDQTALDACVARYPARKRF